MSLEYLLIDILVSADFYSYLIAMLKNISFIAGDRALEIIRDEGLNPDRVRVIPGAAGGPKWLVLGGIDRILFGTIFSERKEPLFLLGSSIGSWRFAAICQADPVKSIDLFEEAYLDQHYSKFPTAEEVSGASRVILDRYVHDDAVQMILKHPYLRLNMLAVSSRHIFKAASRPPLAIGMVLASVCNIISRHMMGLFFSRTLFYDRREAPPFYDMKGFSLRRVPLDRSNLKPAIMASGSIPMVMDGVSGIPGAPEGVYRDGGMIDYQLDIPLDPDPDRIVLFPHYSESVIPGWLDKHLPWRKAKKSNMRNVLIVSPSRHFVDNLPYGKIPDRNDFMKFSGHDAERLTYWKKSIEAGRHMGEEFYEALLSGKIRTMVKRYQP
ncbi:MAG: hypothetical protein JXA07_09675 [Spirochaetes bacterium]|nr:hypothetical protein [Spirochaetota bacterium]